MNIPTRALAALAMVVFASPSFGQTIPQRLADLGISVEAGTVPDIEPTRVKPLVEGVIAFAYTDADGTTIVLAADADVLGKYKLPGGDEFDFRTPDGRAVAPQAVLDDRLLVTRSEKGWGWLGDRLTLTPVDPGDAEVRGASVDESAVAHTLRVGSDGDFATFAEAADRAQELLDGGEGVRLELAAGTYREGGIVINAGPNPDATLIIEGVPGETIITGADPFTGGWEPIEPNSPVYRKSWPHRFGMSPQGWDRWGFLLTSGTSRSEVVSIDGDLMMPVELERFRWVDPDGPLTLQDTDVPDDEPGRWQPAGRRDPRELVPGTFGVVEAEDMIYLCPPEGVDPNGAKVEASVRGALLTINDRRNVVLRGLTFTHAATHAGSHENPVSLRVQNLLVERCAFDRNGSKGMALGSDPTQITLRHSTFNGNGWKGFSAGYRPDDYVMEYCESSFNNWRGHSGGQHSWDAAGVKFFGLNGQTGVRIVGHRAFANLTHGLWIDQSFTPRAPIEIRDSIYAGNYFGADLYLEKLTGPVDVVGNVLWTNRGLHGVNGTSWNMRFADNLMHAATGNRPIFFLHKRGEESEYANHSRDWTLDGNLLTTRDGGQLLQQASEPQQYAEFLDTLATNGNVVHGEDSTFFEPSLMADPQYANPDAYGWDVTNPRVREALPNLPGPLSDEDRAKLERADRNAQRYLEVIAASRSLGGPPFDRAQAIVDNAWRQLDLSPVLNRNLTGNDAWIGAGNQLPQLRPGDARFAGVPFELRDGGLVLRSAKVTESRGKPTPVQVDVPVGDRVEVLYVLHGGGWFDGDPAPTGRYELVYEDGTTAGVDVVPESKASDPSRPAMVGEWYHAFTPFDNDVARHIALPGDLGENGAYLYVVEIVNPHPDRPVAQLRLVGELEREITLIILAATYARP